MWMFGVMSKKQMKELKKAGYEVKVYNSHAFNVFLCPKQNFIEFKSDKDQLLVGTWVDGDVYDTLKKVIFEEEARKNIEYR